MKMFERCAEISDLLTDRRESAARDKLIGLIDELHQQKSEYSPLVNHLLRETGLYPYLKKGTADWQDRFAMEAFKVDVGNEEFLTLHREQSDVLRMLCDGKSVAVSAPTSFGKSFVIDAFIAIKKPRNVVIIVPTIALMDETRRRLFKKFWESYRIITTSDSDLGSRNICIFPQERALGYIEKFEDIDLLVIDEFYKASVTYDKERSASLVNAILKLGRIARQKYFLAPNISSIKECVFTKGVQFVDKMHFNTVLLEKHELYQKIGKDEELKSEYLLKILNETKTKSLVYAAYYKQIDLVAELLIRSCDELERPLLKRFSKWIDANYGNEWYLAKLVLCGAGVHNGQIHRSLSQIQLKLFDEKRGIDTIISTSSIVEGVNTSAENVIIWKNRKGYGTALLDTFAYKNIIGRGGRMFRYFVGKIYLLEKPPLDKPVQLEIDLPDSILGDIDEGTFSESLSKEQVAKIIGYREYMIDLLGEDAYTRLFKEKGVFQGGDFDFIKDVATAMKQNPRQWMGLAYLNSDNPDDWDGMLFAIIKLVPPGRDIDRSWTDMVTFVKILSRNWSKTIPRLLDELKRINVDVQLFFKMERYVTFKLSSILHDVNVLQKEILKRDLDVSKFVSKLSNAFLPPVVYNLEEFGLPRMIARKIQQSGLVNLQEKGLDVHSVLDSFRDVGIEAFDESSNFDPFDHYVLAHFFDGIGMIREDDDDL